MNEEMKNQETTNEEKIVKEANEKFEEKKEEFNKMKKQIIKGVIGAVASVATGYVVGLVLKNTIFKPNEYVAVEIPDKEVIFFEEVTDNVKSDI